MFALDTIGRMRELQDESFMPMGGGELVDLVDGLRVSVRRTVLRPSR